MPPTDRTSRFPITFGRRGTKGFVVLMIAMILAISASAVWVAYSIDRDPELKEQLQEVHERAARRDPPTEAAGR